MEPNPLFQFNTRDVFRVLFRHKWRSLFVFAATIGLVVAALIYAPRTYVSEAQLLINVGDESLNADPTMTGARAVSLQVAREEEIKSMLDLFRSHAVSQAVVQRLGAERILERDDATPRPHSVIADLKVKLAALLRTSRPSDNELAIGKIRKKVSVDSEPRSNVIRIVARASSPKLSQEIVAAYVESAKQKHSEAHRKDRSTVFLQSKMESVQRKLTAANAALRDVKNRVGVVSIDGRKSTLEQQLRELQLDLAEARGELRDFESKIGTLQVTYGSLPELATSDTATSATSNSLDEMLAEVFRLRLKAREIAATYQPSHPRHLSVTTQLTEAERDLAVQELRFAQAGVASQKAKIASLNEELMGNRTELEELNQDEAEIKTLESEVKLLETRYETYNADVARSQVLEDRQNEQITNINVFQPASFVETPVSPNRKLLLAFGAAVALFGAVGAALASELLDSSFKTPENIETQLELPVLESVPVERRSII